MLNEQANIQLAQQLANSRNRNVAIYANSRGQVNIQYEGIAPLRGFDVLQRIVEPVAAESEGGERYE